MGFPIFKIEICNDGALILFDNRSGMPSRVRGWESIKNILNQFIGRPHKLSAWGVYEVDDYSYYIAPGVCIVRVMYSKIIWEGEPFKIDGKKVSYSFEKAVELLTLYETPKTCVINNLAVLIRNHPDFHISPNMIYVRDGGYNSNFGRKIISVLDDEPLINIKIHNMFDGITKSISFDDACSEIHKLLLAFNPPLCRSEKTNLGPHDTAYPNFVISYGKIITSGYVYNGKGYSFEDYKK
jgi:hypothetical protein